ncbi:hypothetical protein COCMIDRAFT_105545 [Bipolaris oryzae ATCC 44560]|uniref:Uncharacterized protein n=1 Tax=Bipolaris oryzae ATCC 44560 TaxID=930090 RepID=W6YVU6_COCMI|nr:uncharacterized protein COCMIDRAFT_105545 [Bipolaris oryzae ATCC 44560]EUC41653.1 hypothetical protein COCMIDRAFT_105545 [Bipolaris oryzae ATCC 44560]
MFCFSEWRLELRLCPATTLMHSAVEKARFGSSLANGHGDYHSVRSSRLVSVDRSTSMRFEFLASCTLFGRSVAPRSLPTSLSLFDSPHVRFQLPAISRRPSQTRCETLDIQGLYTLRLLLDSPMLFCDCDLYCLCIERLVSLVFVQCTPGLLRFAAFS